MDARQFVVASNEAGARLDIWLTRKMPEFSRNQIKHLLDQGRVLVNHRRVLIAGWELEPSDNVEVRVGPRGVPEIRDEPRPQAPQREMPPTREMPRPTPALRSAPVRHEPRPQHQPRPHPPRPQQQTAASRPGFLEVIFEDRDIIVCEKPAGVLTEPKQGSPHDHLLGLIKNYLKRKHPEARGSYIKLLHRLDRDTSGVIVAAKSKVGEQLEDQFRKHIVERQYVAVVEGRVEKEAGRIDFALEKGDFHGGRKIRVVRGSGGAGGAGLEGMPAITDYKVKERYGKATLVAVTVQTGRTHQVRAHFAEIGHPLAGDTTYGSKMSFGRHALHACLLAFHHPRTKERMRFESKLPEDMMRLIDGLREQG